MHKPELSIIIIKEASSGNIWDQRHIARDLDHLTRLCFIYDFCHHSKNALPGALKGLAISFLSDCDCLSYIYFVMALDRPGKCPCWNLWVII